MAEAVKIGDDEVVAFLDEFREKSLEEQQSSPVWQALVSFPQWGMANYAPPELGSPPPAVSPLLPDPRIPANMRPETVVVDQFGRVAQRPPAPQPAAPPGAPPQRSITTSSTMGGQPQNPWADQTPPQGDGVVFYGVRTPIPPPWPGNWQRLPEGWVRR